MKRPTGSYFFHPFSSQSFGRVELSLYELETLSWECVFYFVPKRLSPEETETHASHF